MQHTFAICKESPFKPALVPISLYIRLKLIVFGNAAKMDFYWLFASTNDMPSCAVAAGACIVVLLSSGSEVE